MAENTCRQGQTPCAYTRKIYYYETDNMGIVHHSNYIRLMEEARMDFMGRAGYEYRGMEELGIIMPVTYVKAKYIKPLHFDDVVHVKTRLIFFNGIRASFDYQIFREGDDTPSAEGESGHCFLDTATRVPVNLKKRCPQFYARAMEIQEKDK